MLRISMVLPNHPDIEVLLDNKVKYPDRLGPHITTYRARGLGNFCSRYDILEPLLANSL